MLYLIDTTPNVAKIAAQGGDLLAREGEATRAMYEAGTLLRIWRKGDARGAVALWNLDDHSAVQRTLAAMPIYDYLRDIEVTPLCPHNLFPQFSEFRPETRPLAEDKQLFMVRLRLDRSAFADNPDETIEKAEETAKEHVERGLTVGIWRLATGSGARVIWEARDNAEVHREIAALPLLHVMMETSVSPLLPFPGYEKLAAF